jgi:hypothetical protein
MFDPRFLPGPLLIDLPDERYQELRRLDKTISRSVVNPTELLYELTHQLPREVVDQLREILEGGIESVHEVLVRSRGPRRGPTTTEDSFLALAWLQLAYQALREEEPGPLAVRIALERTRNETDAQI